jgi:tetratricopeptide (TPR) repeat protein
MATILTFQRPEPDWFARGLSAELQGDLHGAAALFRTAVDRRPRHAEAWFRLGAAMMGLAHREEAENALLKAIDCDQAHIPAWRKLSNLYASLGRGRQYRFCLGWLLMLDRTDVAARRDLALSLEAEARTWEAKRHWLYIARTCGDETLIAEARVRLQEL